MAQNDDNQRAYSIGTVNIEGRLASDIRNISKNDDRPAIAATVFGNSTKYNGHEGSIKFSVIVNGPRAKAIWENKDQYKKGMWVMAGGELFAGEEYDDEVQNEIAGWGSYLNPNHKWAEDAKGGGRSSRSRDDDDEEDDDRSSRSSRSSGRSSRGRGGDDEESSSRSSGRSSRRRGGDEEEDDAPARSSDRSSRRRSRVQDAGDSDD